MPFNLELQLLPNGFETLQTDAPYQEIGRVYGAIRYQDKWILPAEMPFIIKVLEDLEKLRCYKAAQLNLHSKVRHGLDTKILANQTIPVLGKTTLRPHQVKACQKTFTHPRFGLYMDPRTGKTLTMLYTIKQLGLKALVICPRISCGVWVEEAKTHFDDITAMSIYGEDKKTRESLLQQAISPQPDIIITSFENLRIFPELAQQLDYNCIIVDEAHRIKSYSAERTKAIIKAAHTAKHRYLLTGTPTQGSPTDIYAQMQVLSAAILSNWSYWQFTQRFLTYSRPDRNNRRYPVGEKNIDVLNELIAPYILRIRQEECEGLPTHEEVHTAYKLSPAQKKLYKEIAKENTYTINKQTYPIANPANKFFKLAQVCSGFIYDPDNIPHYLTNPKLDLLLEQVEDQLADPTHKIIIWCNFNAEQDLLATKLDSYGVLQLRGGTTDDPFSIIKQFTDLPDRRVLIAKQSMGISVDISCASTAYVFSRSPSLDFDRQSRDRMGGYKQTKKTITTYYYDCPATVDSQIHALINTKESLDKQLTDINIKCIGCTNLVTCLNKHIKYKDPTCSPNYS